MVHHGGYVQWPFLTQEEFELACAHFDQKYIQAKLGPTRKAFKVAPRRTITTGATYIEIIRLLQLLDAPDDLVCEMAKLGAGEPVFSQVDIDMADAEEEDDVGNNFLMVYIAADVKPGSFAPKSTHRWTRRRTTWVQYLLSPTICDIRDPPTSHVPNAHVMVQLARSPDGRKPLRYRFCISISRA